METKDLRFKAARQARRCEDASEIGCVEEDRPSSRMSGGQLPAASGRAVPDRRLFPKKNRQAVGSAASGGAAVSEIFQCKVGKNDASRPCGRSIDFLLWIRAGTRHPTIPGAGEEREAETPPSVLEMLSGHRQKKLKKSHTHKASFQTKVTTEIFEEMFGEENPNSRLDLTRAKKGTERPTPPPHISFPPRPTRVCRSPLCTNMVTSVPLGHLLSKSTTWLCDMDCTFLLLTSTMMSPSLRPRQRG